MWKVAAVDVRNMHTLVARHVIQWQCEYISNCSCLTKKAGGVSFQILLIMSIKRQGRCFDIDLLEVRSQPQVKLAGDKVNSKYFVAYPDLQLQVASNMACSYTLHSYNKSEWTAIQEGRVSCAQGKTGTWRINPGG